MPKFVNNADFSGNQAVNMAAEVLGSAPGSAALGRIYYDSGDVALKVCTNATGPVFATLATGTTSFATPTIALSTAASAGSAGTAVRSDATIAAFDSGTPTVSAVGDSAQTGSANYGARRDHSHGRESFGAVTSQTTFGASSGNGSAATLAHSDHTHGTPTHLHADHNAIVLNDLATATAGYNMGGFVITNGGTPSGSSDLTTKSYVDNVAQGLSPKNSVRAATTGAETFTIVSGSVTVITGTTVDGQSPGINDRILIKDAPAATGGGSANSTQPGNGIYTVTNNTTNLTVARAVDMDDANDPPAGAFVFVEAGTSNPATGWVVSSPTAGTAFTFGTNNVHWTQFSGGGTYSADGSSLTLTGNQFKINTSWVGQAAITTLGTIGTGTWQAATIGILYGGTAATTAAGARGTSGLGGGLSAPGTGSGIVSASDQGIPTKVIATIGDGSTTSFAITHNLGTVDVTWSCYAAATPYGEVIPDAQHTSTNVLTLIFATAPTASQFKVVIIG